MKRWPAVLIFLLLLMPVFSMPVSGDGCAITVIDGYSTLRENRQLAYVYVGEKEESLNLFISVVSLDPGQPLTIVVPLKTHPTGLRIFNTTESNFRSKQNFGAIERESIRQHEGAAEVGKEVSSLAQPLSSVEVFGAPAIMYYLMSGGMTGSAGLSPEYYGQPGLSVDVYSFNSSDSLGEFYESMNVSVPQNINDTLTRYQDYSVAVINTVTKPPIKESDFNNLMRAEPGVMADFKEYVRTHSKITVYGYSFEDKELNDMLERISDYELASTFYNLIYNTYGLGTVNGFHLLAQLPLANGNECYFPLGTSPSWNSITKTTVIFDLYDDKEANFNVPGEQVFMDGRHYYIWDFENEAPDYDISGVQSSKGIGTSWAASMAGLNGWAYDNSPILAIFILLLIFTLIWASLLLYYFRKNDGEFTLPIALKFFGWGIFLAFFSLFFSAFLAVPVAVRQMKEGRDKLNLPPPEEDYKASPLLDNYGWVWQLILFAIIVVPALLALSFISAILPPLPQPPISFFLGCVYLFMLSLTAFHAYVKFRLRSGGPVVKDEPASPELSSLRLQSLFGLVLAVAGLIIFTVLFFSIFRGDSGDLCLILQAGYISLGISVSLAILIYGKRGLLTR